MIGGSFFFLFLLPFFFFNSDKYPLSVKKYTLRDKGRIRKPKLAVLQDHRDNADLDLRKFTNAEGQCMKSSWLVNKCSLHPTVL